jgi:hypothetical protein
VGNLQKLLYAGVLCACFVTLPRAFGGEAATGGANAGGAIIGGGRFSLGINLSAGASGFHGHKALYGPGFGGYAVAPGPAVSGGAGLAAAIKANGVLTAAAEPQYSLYRTHSAFYIRANDTSPKERHTAGADLRSLELPLLARFDISPIYIETGVQPGANLRARIRRDGESEKPRLNRFAAGVTAGFGAAINANTMIGLRGYYSLTEYDKNSNGYPWTVRVSATQYFIFTKGGRI